MALKIGGTDWGTALKSVNAPKYTSTGGKANTSQYNWAQSLAKPASGGSSGGSSSSSSKSSGSSMKSNVDYAAEEQKKAAEAAKKAMQSQIDAEYSRQTGQINAEEGRLTGMQSEYTNQLPITEQQITQSYDSAVPEIQRTQGSTEAGLANQQTTAQQGYTGVTSQARQTYNELLSGVNRVGGSAQDAVSELLGRNLAQQLGGASQELQKTITGIAGEFTRVKEYYGQKLNDLQKNKVTAIEQARADFRANMDKINQAVSQLGQNRVEAQKWKSAQNLNALAALQQKVADINSAAATTKQTLDQWEMERSDALKTTAAQEFKFGFQYQTPQGVTVSGTATPEQYQTMTGAVTPTNRYLKNPNLVQGSANSYKDPVTGDIINY
jgi:hypothetical protein